MTLASLLLLLASASGLSLKGGDVPCHAPNGQDIHIKGITDMVPDIKCICDNGVGKCSKVADECLDGLKGCHFVQKGNSTCSRICRPCQYEDALKPSGETWKTDKCRVSTCFSGVITSSKLECATPMCPDPAPPAEGGCCPTCQGCSRAGQFFRENETKPDVLDPCNECTCKGGRLECVKRACPVLPCSRNLIKSVKGQCCPICARNDSDYVEVPNKCQFRGQSYKQGEDVYAGGDVCTKCKCSHAHFPTVECESETCPPLMCPLHLRRKKAGNCCPYCIEGVADALPSFVAPPTEISARDCVHKGKTYKSGEAWQSGCDECTCWPNGHARCTPLSCPPLECPSGSKMVQKSGQCCPSCEYSEGVCTVFGDPHYKTFDGRIFNFQGSCKYLLAQDCGSGDNNNSSFTVRITNDARDSLAFSWTRTITVRLHDLKISLLQKMRVKINGKKVSLPYILLGKLSVMKDGYRVILRTNEGLKLLWDGVSFLEMTVPPKYRGQICGLCGNFNGDKNDDFYGKEHTHFKDGQHFGDSWRVGGLRACSVLPKDMPHSYEPECTQSWPSKIKSDRYCNALKSALFQKCVNFVDPEYYFNACKLDMCECPGEQCHCEVLTAYARECERAGQLITGWRSTTGCRNVSSFKYAKHDDSSDLTENHIMNDVLSLLPLTTTASTTTTTTTTEAPSSSEVTTTTSSPSFLPWILPPKARDLGPALPGCSPDTVEFCKVAKKREKKRLKHERARARRLRQRRKRKRKQREERWRKRQQRRNKKKRERKMRRKMAKSGEDTVFKMGSVALTMRRNLSDNQKRLKWSSKIPPFEALLSASPDALNMTALASTAAAAEHTEEFIDASGISSTSDDFHLHQPQERPAAAKKGQKTRTPLPLKEFSSHASSSSSSAETPNQRGWKHRKRK